MTMSLIDYTMAPELIKGWIKKVRPFLRCKDKSKQEFEQNIREEQEKIAERDGIDLELEEAGSNNDRIMPFEFLYLLCNARPRLSELKTHMPIKTGVIKEKLSEFYDGDERR